MKAAAKVAFGCAAWIAIGATPALAAPAFKPATEVPMGPGPRSVAVGDLDSDGHDDLAVADLFDGTVHVRLGDGAGGFGPDSTVAVGAGPDDVQAADLNGDGRRDLVTANSFAGTVSVLLGDGSGGFAATAFAAGAFSPQRIAVGDVTGDAAPDVVVSAVGPDRLSVLAGDGSGHLGAPAFLPLRGTSPEGVAVADLNGDAHRDIVVVNSASQSFAVLLADGAGGFGAPVAYGSGGLDPSEVAVADLDQNGHPDVAVSNSGAEAGSIGVRLGNGDGTFGPVTSPLTGGANPGSVVSADFDLDGHPDLATPNLNSDDVGVLAGDGHGGFASPASFDVGSAPVSAAVGDFDQNRAPDLAVVDLGSQSVSILINDAADTVPPVLDLPDPIEVDATGPDGAVVTYVARASDDRDLNPELECSPPSGATFPIGVNTVHCVTTDDAGNSTQGEFTVTVHGAGDQLQRLRDAVDALGLSQGTERSLLAKLDAALASLGRGQTSATCGQLGAFDGAVGAQAGKTLRAVQASDLLATSAQIGAVLACG